jgi:signal peptidase II
MTGDDAGEPRAVPGGDTAGPVRGSGRRRAIALLASLGAASILVDFVTKQLAVEHLRGAEPVRLLGGVLYLDYTTNSGAAFNIGGSYTFVFPLIALAVIAFIVWMSLRLRSRSWAVALGLVLGGAAGNLLDRLVREPAPFRGEVVDMLSLFAPGGSVWPIFNIADASLVVGVMLAVWLELTGRRRDGTRAVRGPVRVVTEP